MSRLCCPVCWDLLAFLKGDDADLKDDLIVRGRHSTMYHVELPHHLPVDVLKGMVNRYKRILFNELNAMVKESKDAGSSGHKRTPSLQSSGGSVSSVSTDDSGILMEITPRTAIGSY